jgi:hypothetical protein
MLYPYSGEKKIFAGTSAAVLIYDQIDFLLRQFVRIVSIDKGILHFVANDVN